MKVHGQKCNPFPSLSTPTEKSTDLIKLSYIILLSPRQEVFFTNSALQLGQLGRVGLVVAMSMYI